MVVDKDKEEAVAVKAMEEEEVEVFMEEEGLHQHVIIVGTLGSGHYSTECDQPPRAGGDMFPCLTGLGIMRLKLKVMKGLVDLLQKRRVRQRWSM